MKARQFSREWQLYCIQFKQNQLKSPKSYMLFPCPLSIIPSNIKIVTADYSEILQQVSWMLSNTHYFSFKFFFRNFCYFDIPHLTSNIYCKLNSIIGYNLMELPKLSKANCKTNKCCENFYINGIGDKIGFPCPGSTNI